MDDRGRLVYALLRSLLAWAPAPTSRSFAVSGFVSGSRVCLHCRRFGRWSAELGRRVDVGCPHCGGVGVRPVKDAMDDPVKDPPSDPRRKMGFGGRSGDDVREARRARDEEIVRLGLQLSSREEDAPAGLLEHAVEARDRLYRLGSYAELEAALERLRDERPVAYRVAMWVAYQPFGEAPVEPASAVVLGICVDLAVWMPDEIRVPASVAVWTVEELELRCREARDALAFGRSAWASATRADRKRLILVLAGEGLSDGRIARRLGLSRQRVQGIRKGLEEALEEQVA